MSRSLPIRRAQFDTQGFLAFVAGQGGEIGSPTNPYEVVRYRAYWRGTDKLGVHIVYAKENGLLTFTGGSAGHYRAFLDGTPMAELPGSERSSLASEERKQLGESKGAQSRRKLLERDGDACWFCGEPMGADCTIEHLIPKARGGTNSLVNYALAHQRCNYAAADMPLVEKIAMRARLRGEIA